MIALWAGVLLVSVWLAHWGAEHLSDPLRKLRRQWGFTVAAGGSFIGLAAASPEIGINSTSAIRNVGDIGLGALLGSNVLAIPIMVVTAYVATRKQHIGGGHTNHEVHRRERLLRVDPQAVTVQALPYLGIIGLFALLTLPAPWRGLQPLDGWILLLGYIAYLAQALVRGREEGERVDWKRTEKWLAAAGVGARCRSILNRLLDRRNSRFGGPPPNHRRPVYHRPSCSAAGGLCDVVCRPQRTGDLGRDKRYGRPRRDDDACLHSADDHWNANRQHAAV